MKKFHKSISAFVLLALLLFTTNALAAPGDIVRVSVDSNGSEGNSYSVQPSISADGRYVVFNSNASNLVDGDTNGVRDIFVYDRATGITTRVSVDSSGLQGNGDSSHPSSSFDGRYVAFDSLSSNLVSGDTNGERDVFVHDRATGVTTRVSVDSSGVQGQGNITDYSASPSISSDGRYVAFTSGDNNLVVWDTNGWDTFMHDRVTGITTRVSVDSSGAQQTGGGSDLPSTPSISSDGRYVAFVSTASNLVANDTNGWHDVFVHDRATGITTRVSVDSSGIQGNDRSIFSSISSDGRYVAFQSEADNLVANDTNGWQDVFVHDRTTGITTRVSVDSFGAQARGWQGPPSISSDGRYVAFQSDASNLVAGDTNGWRDVFVHSRVTGVTTRVSVNSLGKQGNGPSSSHSISSDGRYVAFVSTASNLVSGDTNGTYDIFVHERGIDPFVISTNLSASYNGRGPSSFTVTFSENVSNAGGGTNSDDVTYPANYRIINKGADGEVNTGTCADPLVGDDTQIIPSSVVYTPNTAVVRLSTPLPVGSYRLSVCGTTSIVDFAGTRLNNGVDYTFNFVVSTSSGGGSGDGNGARWLPNTGFAPQIVTRLPEQPLELAYTKLGDLWLEIPSQKIKANIVGVPQSKNVWDVKWLGQDAGWLNGTAFPTWGGNSVITAHVMGADGLPGPFAKLQDLQYGEQIIVHLSGQQYIFEVRNKQLVRPDSIAFALEHLEDASYLTLVTCSGYNEESNTYSFRRLVRAVLVEVK
ncbi:MAG: PD40 domain-containing protein [Chloroflexi bacterium]|nr:PD40 domain-containing protein [Chloroflexota bacterium]